MDLIYQVVYGINVGIHYLMGGLFMLFGVVMYIKLRGEIDYRLLLAFIPAGIVYAGFNDRLYVMSYSMVTFGALSFVLALIMRDGKSESATNAAIANGFLLVGAYLVYKGSFL